MTERLEIIEIGNRKIVVKGIGKLFYEDGFPIHISVDILKEKGYEVSILHIAYELYKNGWSERAIVNTLSQDFEGSSGIVTDFVKVAMEGEKKTEEPPLGQEWLYSQNGYEKQQQMLFESLFSTTYEEVKSNDNIRKMVFTPVKSGRYAL